MMDGGTMPFLCTFKSARDEGTVPIFSNIREESFHLVCDPGKVQIYRFGVDKCGLVGDKEAKGLRGWCDVEIMQFAKCKIGIECGQVREVSGRVNGHS
jgi:hypothetical protein